MAATTPVRHRTYTADGFIRSRLSIMSPFVPAIVKRQVSKFELMQRLSTPSNTTTSSVAGQWKERSNQATGTHTPPPAYDETLSPLSTITLDKKVVIESGSTPISTSSPAAAAAAAIAAANAFQEQDPENIQWKYGGQGLNLLTLSAQESTSDPIFSRQLYIHSLTYLLRGLPATLNHDEQTSLRAAIPPSLHPPSSPSTTQSDSRAEQTLLHRVVAYLIFNIFILVTYLIPHIQTLLATAYSYEREHRVAQRVFAKTMDAADALRRKSCGVMNSVYGVNGGKLGKVLEEVLLWWIKGVCGGVHDGLGEGFKVMGVKAGGSGTKRR